MTTPSALSWKRSLATCAAAVFALSTALIPTAAVAQSAAAIAPTAPNAADAAEALQLAERGRIQAEREMTQTLFATQEAQCYQTFAVNDCLSRVRHARRDILADLRRQDLVLTSAEAKRKAANQLLRADGKASAASAQTQAAQLANAQAEQQERQRVFDEKALQRRVLPGGAPSGPSGTSPGVGSQ